MSALQNIQDEFDKNLIIWWFKEFKWYLNKKHDCYLQVEEVSQMLFSTIQQNYFVL